MVQQCVGFVVATSFVYSTWFTRLADDAGGEFGDMSLKARSADQGKLQCLCGAADGRSHCYRDGNQQDIRRPAG